MLTEALIEREIAEGYGDDSLVPPTPPDPPKGQTVHKLPAPSLSHEGKSLEAILALDEARDEPSFEPATFEPERFGPITDPAPTGLESEMLTAAWSWRWFPMGGWVYWQTPTRMQRVDQGQDFEVVAGHHVIAPSWGKCIRHLSDRPWPSGFGSPYAVVWIGGPCRFQNRFWYIGHDNGSPIIPAGHWFHSEDVLATPNHAFSYGWRWTELGHAPNGYPGPFGEGARWHWAFSPAKKWAAF